MTLPEDIEDVNSNVSKDDSHSACAAACSSCSTHRLWHRVDPLEPPLEPCGSVCRGSQHLHEDFSWCSFVNFRSFFWEFHYFSIFQLLRHGLFDKAFLFLVLVNFVCVSDFDVAMLNIKHISKRRTKDFSKSSSV